MVLCVALSSNVGAAHFYLISPGIPGAGLYIAPNEVRGEGKSLWLGWEVNPGFLYFIQELYC